MSTSIREDYLDITDSEFPKFVFCIPQELTKWRTSYEEQLWISTANYNAPPESWQTYPFRVTPMIFDMGYTDGSGYDTSFALCHRMNMTWKYFSLWLDESKSGNPSLYFLSSNGTAPFLDVYFSLNPSSEDVFLPILKGVKLTLQESYGGCTEFMMNHLKRTEFLRIGEDCLAQDEPAYNQAFCLDRCIQQEIRKRMDINYR